MTIHRPFIVAVAAVVVGCAAHRQPPIPPAPSDVQQVVLAEPVNRTGGELVVVDPGLFERLMREERSTVPGLLAGDLRARLEQQGFRLGDRTSGDAPVLRTEIRRWEPFAADYSTVTVDIDAALVDTGGRELWSVTRTGWSVATPGAESRVQASALASVAIAEALVGSWEPSTR